MTVTHAPALPADHPADLVIDVYGTFLGKRSERLVVRWRETEGAANTAPLEDPGEPETPHVPFPHRSPDNSTATRLHSGNSAETSGDSSVVEQSESELPNEDLSQNNANQATRQLLSLWREKHAIPPAVTRPRPAVRLGNQLSQLAEDGQTVTPSGWSEQLVPLSRLRSLLVAGRGVTISSDLIGALVERGITLAFLSGRGQPIANLSSPGLGGTVQTRRSQLEAYRSPLGVQLAVEFVRGKLRNQKHQLQYSGKYLKGADPVRFERLEKKIAAIGNIRKQLGDFEGTDLEQVRDKLMGFEGTGARLYWEGVAILLEGHVEFPGRITRGALDPINAALNYGYGILYAQVSGALANAGLELYAGFLHVDRPGKPSLVLDMVEEFRAPVVDRSVLAIANQNIPVEVDEQGLTKASRSLVGDRILERLQTPVPYEGKQWPLVTVIQNQSRHLAVAVRGERVYRCFASRW